MDSPIKNRTFCLFVSLLFLISFSDGLQKSEGSELAKATTDSSNNSGPTPQPVVGGINAKTNVITSSAVPASSDQATIAVPASSADLKQKTPKNEETLKPATGQKVIVANKSMDATPASVGKDTLSTKATIPTEAKPPEAPKSSQPQPSAPPQLPAVGGKKKDKENDKKEEAGDTEDSLPPPPPLAPKPQPIPKQPIEGMEDDTPDGDDAGDGTVQSNTKKTDTGKTKTSKDAAASVSSKEDETVPKKPDAVLKMPYGDEPENSHFLAYLLTIGVLCVAAYLVAHNRHKIMAMLLEGRQGRGARRGSGGRGAKYKRLSHEDAEGDVQLSSRDGGRVIY